MKKQNFIILGIILLAAVSISSCGKEKPSTEENPATQTAVPEADLTEPAASETEQSTDTKEEAVISSHERFSPDTFRGIYLPSQYISVLLQTKSHIKASALFAEKNPEKPCALIFRENTLDPIWNFHEGSSETILEFAEDRLVTDSYGQQKTYIPLGTTTCTLTQDNTEYIQISNDTENPLAINRYIASLILGNCQYTNQDTTFECSDGQIIYQGTPYSWGTELIFASKTYDTLAMQNSPYEERFIEVLEDRINIYKAEVPEEYATHPMYLDFATYTLENTFLF